MKRKKVNNDIMQGKWTQLRGQAKEQWGNLTDSEPDKTNGQTEPLAGLLQQKYGYTTEKAHSEIDSFMKAHYTK
jgi:uncharacterized protein YjbJ (UPF0337 family)